MLMEAAMYGQVDYCRGTSENLILGQLPNIGTNEFLVHMDTTASQDLGGKSLLDDAKAQDGENRKKKKYVQKDETQYGKHSSTNAK